MSSDTGRLRTVRDEDAPARSGRFAREDSRAMELVRRARDAEPDSDDEREVAKTLQQLEDVHDGIVAITELAAGFARMLRGGKWAAGLLAAAITVNPVIGGLFAQDGAQLDAIEDKLDQGQTERRALAVWLWELEQCRQGQRECPKQPPASVRLMLAETELGR